MSSDNLKLVWLRRDLRLHDHTVIAKSLDNNGSIQFIFIFDKNILKNFNNPEDRRISFLANQLYQIHIELKKHGGSLLVFHGEPIKIFTSLLNKININSIFAAEDFEPSSIERDKQISDLAKKNNVNFELILDHLIHHPTKILKQDKTAFKVYTPYSKEWVKHLDKNNYQNHIVNLKNRLFDDKKIKNTFTDLPIIDLDSGPEKIVSQIGYKYQETENIWPVKDGQARLKRFVHNKINQYKNDRDRMDLDGTSCLSPYLRFGLISIRECLREMEDNKHLDYRPWLNELIWREFYCSILYHFPHSQNLELTEKYQNKIPWKDDQKLLEKWQEGKTGYPVIDAAMRQLKEIGWMHNRARMITASFLTKNLFIDWRLGEKYFGQYLMDYELASNVGGWQWSSSTGTDAQPYFRIFNPELQSRKFDPEGIYIRKYIKELADSKEDVHSPKNYYKPIVDYSETRKIAIENFKKI